MELDTEALAERYAAMDDELLLELHGQGTLQDAAYGVLEAVLTSRNISIPPRPTPLEVEESGCNQSFATVLANHWLGRARLATAYWLFYVVGTTALGYIFKIVSAILLPDDSGVSIGTLSFVIVLWFGLLTYVAFCVVAVWRCAPNSGWFGWGIIARILVVVTGVAPIVAILGWAVVSVLSSPTSVYFR